MENTVSVSEIVLPDTVKKLNVLIHAKNFTTREQDLIINHSLDCLVLEGNQLQAKMEGYELANALGIEDKKNLSRTLQKAATGLVGNVIIIEGETDEEFEIFAIVTNAEYKNGKFTMAYNSKMTPYLENITGKYTLLDRAMESNFQGRYTVKLYELLKSEAFHIRKDIGYHDIDYNINELRCMLGLVNLDKPYVQNAKKTAKYSWDELVENIVKPEDKMFERITKFKSSVLNPAVEEINEKSDLRCTYSEKKGLRGKIETITFRISYAKAFDGKQDIMDSIIKQIEVWGSIDDAAITKIKKDDRIPKKQKDELLYLLGGYQTCKQAILDAGISTIQNFTIQYYKDLLRISQDNKQLILDQIEYGKTCPKIRNYFGWLRKAVEFDYCHSKDIPAEYGSEEDAKLGEEMNASIQDMSWDDISWRNEEVVDAIVTDPMEEEWEAVKENRELLDDFLHEFMKISEVEFERKYSASQRINIFEAYKTSLIRK